MDGATRWMVVGSTAIALGTGCAGAHTSSLLLQRHARGPMEANQDVGKQEHWVLEPVTQTQEQGKVEVTVRFAWQEYLTELFQRRDIFGQYAGRQPFFSENLVFYVKIANHGDEKINIDPAQFVLLDGRGNQYGPIGGDYVTALAESKSPTSTVTRGILDEARPGYFGVSLPVGKVIGKSQVRYAMMERSSLQRGLIYPSVVHDGLLAFWSPVKQANSVTLIVTGIKTDFSADDLPQRSLEFSFHFNASTK